jgi:hypothetical protein
MPRFEVEIVKRVYVTCADPAGAEKVAASLNERGNEEAFMKGAGLFRYQDFPPVSARVVREVALENMAKYADRDSAPEERGDGE